ncbi:hypothetical protein WEH80_04000 [Actinomycetes bacterium KLBMP 9759]
MGTAYMPVFEHALPHRGDGSAPHVPAADAPARLAALVEARRERLEHRAQLHALSHRGGGAPLVMELDEPLGSGRSVSFRGEPGLLWDGVVSDPEQEVAQIRLDGEPDALEASELLADLAFLTR